MKTIAVRFLPGLLIGLLATTAQGQGQYQTTMGNLITQIDTTKGAVENLKLANTFGRIADVEKTQWLPYYYASYFTVLEALQQSDLTKVDLLTDQASTYLDQADMLAPKNSEVYCLRSMIVLSRIKVNQAARGMSGLLQAQQMLEAAHTYDANNPRVYFMLGQQAFNTPEVFGGSKENALRYFEKSLALMDTQKEQEKTINVHWGRSTTTQMITACRKKLQIAQN